MKAAGVMLQATNGRVLFLKRSPGSDMPRRWALPGGGVEDEESAEECAIRELDEECDVRARPEQLGFWCRTDDGGVEFTTFIVRGCEEFEPHLNNEHTDYLWADPKTPPRPLHPGVEIALERFGMDELAIAKAMVAGRLAGPQDYENICLFNMRITGTGVAFRHKWDEYVMRDPGLYLNEEFLQRCNGLPVILEHPKDSNVLTTKEWRDRVVGTIMLPYIKGDEVWGIAKVYDQDACHIMKTEQLSTSPAVIWRDPDVNTVRETSGGVDLMVEGKPSLLDHLAVCRQGVWDKGGDPTGIETLTAAADSIMPKFERLMARADALWPEQ
jgi:8-oxo-dGTP pyrophosphatase MutT (NUDIX family)